MNFSCNTEIFKNAIIASARICTNKNMKNSECIFIETKDNQLILNVSDSTTSMKTIIEASISEEGIVALPAKILQDIISRLNSSETCFKSENNNTVRMLCGNTDIMLQCLDFVEYPEFPEISGETISIKKSEFQYLIDSTSFAVYIREDKPIYKGIKLDASEGVLSAIALDGIRMAKRSLKLDTANSKAAIVPAKALREAARLIGDDELEIKLLFNDNSCFIMFCDTLIHTRLLDGEFLDYNRIIPKEPSTSVRIQTKSFEKALDTVSVMAKEDNTNLVKLNITKDGILISANSEYGSVCDYIPCELTGEHLKIAFNARYLMDALKAIDDDFIIFDFESELKPMAIRPVEGDDFIYVIVPVNIRNKS